MPEYQKLRFEAAFIDGVQGRLFQIRHLPRGKVRGGVLYVHPFAEEMNKSRRMAALQARALSEAGYMVLQPDLYGCGDSTGDFGEACWSVWQADIQYLIDKWYRSHPHLPLVLWGLRSGCLLLSSLFASASVQCCHLRGQLLTTVFWQPILSGAHCLSQFLRLRVAAAMLSDNAERLSDLRDQLKQGQSLEVAGYQLSAQMAAELSEVSVHPPPCGTLYWFEVGGSSGVLSGASAQQVGRWQAAGTTVVAQRFEGDSFWVSTEISEVPALIEATTAVLTQAQPQHISV